MRFEVTPQPAFSWSVSRAGLLARCYRRYYLRVYGGHNGWLADSDPHTRHLYALRFLTTPEQILGIAMHECARLCVKAVQAKHALPDMATLQRILRTRLNDASRCRSKESFFRAPKQLMLLDVYYGRGLSRHQIERVQSKMKICIHSLLSCPIWGELSECAAGDILLVDTLSTSEIDGTLVYVAPDLAYRTRAGVWTLVDWKTGATRDVMLQLAVYGMYLERALGIPCPQSGYEGRVYRLDAGEVLRFVLDRDDLNAATAVVRSSIREMRDLLSDPAANIPKPIDQFPATADRALCPSCPYQEVCVGHGGSA